MTGSPLPAPLPDRLLFITPGKADRWKQELQRQMPGVALQVWPDDAALDRIEYALAWNPPAGVFPRLPNLKAVFNLGAGVDRLLSLADFPRHLPLIRVVDGGMGRQMAEYAAYAALHYHRRFDLYADQQRRAEWRMGGITDCRETRIGILGLGTLGQVVAERLLFFGFPVAGWSRTPKQIPGVSSHAGDAALPGFLAASDILIVLLPLTGATRGLLNAERLALLPQGAAVVNLARGALIDDDALLAALDRGHLRGAMLDVFAVEPLPADHRYWRHPKVIVTPHISAATLPDETVAQIRAALADFHAGRPVAGLVDIGREY